jgi:two-component system, sensor histidine kinase
LLTTTKLKFLILGIGFGLFFPILGTALVCAEDGCTEGILALHQQSRLMQIIDLAPLVLGIFSYSLGINVDRRTRSERLAREVVAQNAAIQHDLALALQHQNDELKELNATMEALVYTASHDLKTPVINFESLLTMLRMVKDMPDSKSKIDEIIGRMDGAVLRFRATIDDLLEVSNLEVNPDLERATISLQEVLAHVVALSQALIVRENAQLEFDKVDEYVIGTQHALVVVFQNLIANAIQYHHPDRSPEIKVSTKVVGEMLEITLTDNGRGIDLEKQGGKIFKMFTRLQNTEAGTGIGLYLVKRTLDKLGGRVRIDSQIGIGTTFVILLPHAMKP